MAFENNIEIFSSRDKIRDQLITYAKDIMQLEDFDFNKTSYLSYFINMLSVMTADLIYYNSSAWKEFFLTKAQQRDSVINLSAMLGYQPDFATPSTATILFSIPLDLSSSSVVFKLYGATDPDSNIAFKFYSGNITFSLLNNIEFRITRSSTSVYSAEIIEYYSQGEIGSNSTAFKYIPNTITESSGKQYLNCLLTASQVYEFSSDVSNFVFPAIKKYEFYTKDIEYKDGYISDIKIITENTSVKEQLYSNGITSNVEPITWVRYASIPLIPEDAYGYVLRQTSKGLRVYFGNGVYGKQPTQSDTVYINMHLTNGSLGNVIPGSINKCDSVSYVDNDKNKRIVPQVINSEPSVYGADAPSIDDIRAAAIAQVSTNHRLVTKYDYDNFANVVEDIPVRTTLQVLKRSDLKCNEISLFTDLVYNDTVNNDTYVVPTRNALWTLDTTGTDGTDYDGNPIYTIRNDDVITIDGDDYVSLFNIEINPLTLDTRYYYTADNLEVPATITNSKTSNTIILPTYANFYISRATSPNDDKSYFEIYYDLIDETKDPTNLICQVEIPWSGAIYNLPHTVLEHKFYLDFTDYLPLNDIPENSQRIKFVFYYYTDEILTSYVDATIIKSLDSFMMSQVKYLSENSYYVYDVPVILKDYYDNIDKSKFNFYVMSKLIYFDVVQYRMLTDYCNLKLSNTTGKLNNMNLNPLTKDNVYDTNPSVLPMPVEGTRYAVSYNDNPWDIDGGFIATATLYNPTGWTFEKLSVNDYFYVTRTDKKLLYNGEDFVEPIQDIPLQLEIVVWPSSDWSGTDASLVSNIKNTVIDSMYTNFGYQKNVLISEITRLVKSVDGVSNCKVLKPEHDIIFEYDFDDLTESELITFTPDLVYFDTNSINIILR